MATYNEGPVTAPYVLDGNGDEIVFLTDGYVPAYRVLILDDTENAYRYCAADSQLIAGVTFVQGERDGGVAVRLVGGQETVKVLLAASETVAIGTYLALAANGMVCAAANGDLCFGQSLSAATSGTSGNEAVIEAVLNRVPITLVTGT